MIPASQILELAIPQKKIKKIFDEYIIKEESKRVGRTNIEMWLDQENKDYLKNKEKTNTDDQYENITMAGKPCCNKKISIKSQDISKWMFNNGGDSDSEKASIELN